jgi:uncharacterized protein YndB with AHSA1/START domain
MTQPEEEVTGMGEDVVTGASVEVQVELDGSPEDIWALITDVSRIGKWSPECVDGWWVDREGDLPRVGARFEGHNRFPSGFEATVPCVVTQADHAESFAWVTLDPELVVDRPAAIWSYRLSPSATAGRTTVIHRFEHGPGQTGVTRAVDDDPEHAQQIVNDRLEVLRRNMTQTIEAMGQDLPPT